MESPTFAVSDDLVSALTLFAFLGVFGYAYCLKKDETQQPEPEPEIEIEEAGPLTKKDAKAVKKLGDELHKAIEKIVKIEEKLNAIDKKASMADVLKHGPTAVPSTPTNNP